MRLAISFLLAITVLSSSSQDFDQLKKLTGANPDSAILLLSKYLEDENDTIKAVSHQLIGNSYYFKSSYDSAISHYEMSNSLLDSLDQKHLGWMAKNYNNIGVCSNFEMRLEDAYENHRKALGIREALNDPMVTSSLNNIGLVLYDLQNFEDALVYFQKSYNAKIRFNQFSRLSTTIRNISRCYSELKVYDSSIYYLEKGLLHLDSIPNTRERASFYTNLGYNYDLTEDYKKAIEYGKKGFDLKKGLGNNYELINSGINLAVGYRKIGQHAIGEKYLDSLEMMIPDIDSYANSFKYYTNRAYNNYALSNFEKAYDYLLFSRQLSDSITSETNAKLLLDIEEKYQSEQKELEIEKLTAVNELQQLKADQDAQTRIILIVGIIALVVIALLLYSRFMTKSNTNKLLDTKNQELASINQTKDRLFSIISHDLKSPLSSFHLITQSLAENIDALDKTQLKEYLESLRDSSSNVRDMMDNLLKWALTQTDQLGCKMEPVTLGHVLENVIGQLGIVSSNRSIAIHSNFDKNLRLKGDASFLEIVLRNLLSNSIKFTEPGKSIQIESSSDEIHAVVKVSDEGVGMNQEEIDKLLSGEILGAEIQNSQEKGTGLGITLVNELVKKMEGTLQVETSLGKGTTFTLSFKKAA
ncbi:ATP-binding protein [Ekhidna sp.]